jgi:hypothetical protein
VRRVSTSSSSWGIDSDDTLYTMGRWVALIAAVLVGAALVGCGLLFPTGDLVGDDGGAGGPGGPGGDGGTAGLYDLANAPQCPNNESFGLVGKVDGKDIGQGGDAGTSWIMGGSTPYTMDVTWGAMGHLHVEWNTSIAFNQVANDAVCTLTLPDGTVYCGRGQLEALGNGAAFSFSGLSKGPVCPNASAPVSGAFNGCMNDNFM